MTPAINEKRKNSSFLKTKIIVGAAFLLILALGFNSLLTSSSLEKLYVESLASSYQVFGKDLQIKLETALRFGKKLEKFIGMEALLEHTLGNMALQSSAEGRRATNKKESPAEFGRYVAVALPNGKILYSTNETLIDSKLPEKARVNYGKTTEKDDLLKTSHLAKHESTYFVTLPIRDRNKTWVATAVLAFSQKQVRALLNPVLVENVKTGVIILACSVIILLMLLFLILPRERAKIMRLVERIINVQFKTKKKGFPRRTISILLFCVIILSQLLFSGLGTTVFKDYYLNITKEKSAALITLLRNDVEYLLSKGLDINKLVKMEVMMGKILPALPEVNDISIFDNQGNVLYMADRQGVIDFTKNDTGHHAKRLQDFADVTSEYKVRINIIKDEERAGFISTTISKKVVLARLREIVLDSLTVLAIAILFSVELLILVFPLMQKREIAAPGRTQIHYAAIRPAAFLFLFGVDISISFLPLHMEKLYVPMFGLSKDMVMGLPISVEMFFAAISILAAGAWLDRRGWHEPFLSGLLLSGMGVLYSWLAPDAFHFIVSRGVVGLGYGLSWMACQGFVLSHTDEDTKTQGLAQLFAGIMAGSICGGAAGAMLADRVGYYPVFLVGAVIVFSVLAYTIVFLRRALRKPAYYSSEPPTESVNKRHVLEFFLNRNVCSVILLSAFPGAVAVVGFLYYFSPVYLNRIGTSQSTIGRILMIYGICLIYLGPFVSKYADRSSNKKAYVVISGILGSLGFVIFWLIEGPIATALAILLLGLSSSFGVSRRSYILKLEISRKLGPGTAMGLFNSAMRTGQVLGPIMFGWLIVATEVSKGITYFGLAYLFITFIFLVSAQSDRTITVDEKNKAGRVQL